LPAQVVANVEHLAHEVFSHAFVAAMRPAMLLPIAIVLLAAVLCFGVRTHPRQVVSQPNREVAVA
jgi:hypothetical protein